MNSKVTSMWFLAFLQLLSMCLEAIIGFWSFISNPRFRTSITPNSLSRVLFGGGGGKGFFRAWVTKASEVCIKKFLIFIFVMFYKLNKHLGGWGSNIPPNPSPLIRPWWCLSWMDLLPEGRQVDFVFTFHEAKVQK